MSNDHLRTCFRKQVYQITLTSDIYRELTFLHSFFFLAMMRKVVWWIVDFQAKFIWIGLELMGKWMQLLNSMVMDCIGFYQCYVKHFSLELHACFFPQQDIFTSSTDQTHLSSAIRKDVCYHYEHKCLVWLLRVEKWEDMFTRSTGRNCVINNCASYQMLNKLSCGVSRDMWIFHMVTESSVN